MTFRTTPRRGYNLLFKETLDSFISELFANGENGIALNSVLSTMYQDNPGTVLADNIGESVKLWSDVSGNNNHATAVADGNRPVLQATGVQFNGSNQYLICHALASIVAGEDKPFSAIFKVSVDGGAGSNRVPLSFGRSTSTTSVLYAILTTTNAWRRDKQQDAAGGTLSSNTLAIETGMRLVIYNDTGIINNIYNRGSVSNTSTQDTGTITLDRCTIGARIRQVTIDLHSPITINTLIVINRILTAAEIQKARRILG